MEAELPDVLDLLRVAIAAGLSPRRALAEVGRRHPGLLAGGAQARRRRAAMGEPAEQALDRLEARAPRRSRRSSPRSSRAERHGAPLAAALAAQAPRRAPARGATLRAGRQGRAQDPARRRAAARPRRAAAGRRGAAPRAHDTLTPNSSHFVPHSGRKAAEPQSRVQIARSAASRARRRLDLHENRPTAKCPANQRTFDAHGQREPMWGAKRVLCCRVGRSGVLCLLRSRSRVAGLLPLRHPGSTDLPSASRSTCALAFTGTFEHTLDAKNRLTIPSKFRADLSKGVFLSRAMDNCVSLYPARDVYGDGGRKPWRRSATRCPSRAASCGGCSTATPWRPSWIRPAA